MNAIAAAARNRAIGRDNRLLFSLPGDMRRFQALTTGGTVIMGRKTLDSLPGGQPLPGRRNIVITRNPAFSRAGCETAASPEEALRLAGEGDNVWLIGGGSVYAALLSRCRRIYLTVVDAAPEADTFFPDLVALPQWQQAHAGPPITEKGLTYRFIDYVNTGL